MRGTPQSWQCPECGEDGFESAHEVNVHAARHEEEAEQAVPAVRDGQRSALVAILERQRQADAEAFARHHPVLDLS